MNDLDDFEKSLVAEKAEREKNEQARQKHHHRKHRHHRHGNHDEIVRQGHDRRSHDDDGHRHKRNRHSRQGDEHRSRHEHGRHHHDRGGGGKERTHHKQRNEENIGARDNSVKADGPVRDAWMTAPSAIQVERIYRPAPKARTPPQEPKLSGVIHSRQLIPTNLQSPDDGISPPVESPQSAERKVDYRFGDAGSSWRMTRLEGVYTRAQTSGRPVEEVAIGQYGSLQEFDDAREEKQEMERRKTYGSGYEERYEPTGDLYRERELQTQNKMRSPPHAKSEPELIPGTVTVEEEPPRASAMGQTALNRLRAQMMKAKLRRASNAAKLEEEYNRAASLAAAAAASSSSSAPEAVVLSMMDARQLAGPRNEVKAVDTRRGRKRGLVQENSDMTIEDMVREERRTKNAAGGDGIRLAERIARDGKYDNDLEYMDENAERLAKRVHKAEISLKNMAVNEFEKMSRILDHCPLCHHEDQGRPPLAPVISLATRVYITLTTEPEVSPGGAVIVPISHRVNLLECDDDEWEEVRNFMKSLTRMYHEQGRDVIFYENAAAPHRRLHAALVAVPIPYSEGATAPAYFKEAFMSADEEWSQHKKIIDTEAKAKEGMGRMAFRKSIAREMPYFHVWFSLDGGLGHVVEDAGRWPRGDLFAREVLGGIVDADPSVVKKQGRWKRGDERAEEWKRRWRKFDWTRVLE